MFNKLVLFSFLLISCGSKSQISSNEYEIQVIKETLPHYLNTISAVSFLEGGKAFNVVKEMGEIAVKSSYLIEKDSLKIDNIKKEVAKEFIRFNKFSDSLKYVIEKNKKITVTLEDTLYNYEYASAGLENLRNENDWNEWYSNLIKEDMVDSSYKSLLTEQSYMILIKKQIALSKAKEPISVNVLNNGIYSFRSKNYVCTDPFLCFKAHKLYRPVFDSLRNVGCYLFSYEANSALLLSFIFIKKINEKWAYVGELPTRFLKRH